MTDVHTARTAADLTAIVDLASTRHGAAGTSDRLLTQAAHHAGARVDRTSLPGGAAMVALAPVADLDVWAARADASERATTTREVRTAADLEDPEDQWPPLQTLWFWYEQWRAHHDHPVSHAWRSTLTGVAVYLRGHLDDAHQRLTTAEWAAFARDVADARRRLEDVLADGERVERGVPCMDPACRGRRLIRKLNQVVNPQKPKGSRIWKHSDWHCPSCKRRYGPVEYRSMVAAAHARTQRESYPVRRDVLVTGSGLTMVVEDDTTWCSVAYAAGVVRRPEATIRSWVHRGDVATVCLLAGRRTGFVSLDDVLTRDQRAGRRTRQTRPITAGA